MRDAKAAWAHYQQLRVRAPTALRSRICYGLGADCGVLQWCTTGVLLYAWLVVEYVSISVHHDASIKYH